MIRIQEILDKVAANNHDANLELIQKAYVFAATAHAGQTRLSGEPYLSHPLAVAYTLADMGFDEPTVAAGLLHDTVEDTGTTIEEIDDKFGEDVADIVDGVTKISMIVFENKEEAQAENIRKMILAMSHDMRVLMVKLADRLHNMSTLDFQKPHKQRRIAQETMDIYAPLANRLGLYLLKRQLEDLSFKYLRPDIYNQIDHWLDAHQVVEKQIIEVAPLAYMRGRTLDDSFIILDEAQNTTPEQMKMFLTRMGVGSKVVVTGDVTQIDLPDRTRSGLVDALQVLKGVNGIAQCYFTEKDVVRHRLVQEIIKAYEAAAHPAKH